MKCVTANAIQSVHFIGKTLLLFSIVIRWHTYGAYELFCPCLPSFVRVSTPAIDRAMRRARMRTAILVPNVSRTQDRVQRTAGTNM
jgi:hypothetical protein